MFKTQLRTARVLVLAGLLGACGGGGDGGGGGGGATGQDALRAEIERLFPYSPATPIDIIYYCERVNSQLQYYFDLRPGGTFDVYSTTDTGQDFTFAGNYTFQNNRLHLTSASFILPLDELSTSVSTAMGMLSAFSTASMQCIAYGHRYNAVENYAHYRCPDINQGAASTESNALEMAHFSLPFNQQVPGSVFRQRDTYVNGLANPIIRRGYGLYRRSGDTWHAWYPLQQFDDFEYLRGSFANADQRVSVEQFGVDCQV